MDLRETAMFETAGTLGYELTADTLQFAGVDSSPGRSSQESGEDEDSDESEAHAFYDDTSIGHDDTYDTAVQGA